MNNPLSENYGSIANCEGCGNTSCVCKASPVKKCGHLRKKLKEVDRKVGNKIHHHKETVKELITKVASNRKLRKRTRAIKKGTFNQDNENTRTLTNKKRF